MVICRLLISLCFFLFLPTLQAAKLAIVIDDFGYRYKIENEILKLPEAVSISVLPNSPHGREMAKKAYQQGHEVLIHLPMAPFVRQSMERDTLFPTMTQDEIEHIIKQAIEKVPYAKGINNHMGSAMTSDAAAMQKLMTVLKPTDYYFLDSMTTGKSKGYQLALQMGIPTLQRNVFLDHVVEQREIRRQFAIAVNIARKKGFAIVIGHPHPETLLILQQELATLASDITLVKPSHLLAEPHDIKEATATLVTDDPAAVRSRKNTNTAHQVQSQTTKVVQPQTAKQVNTKTDLTSPANTTNATEQATMIVPEVTPPVEIDPAAQVSGEQQMPLSFISVPMQHIILHQLEIMQRHRSITIDEAKPSTTDTHRPSPSSN